MRFVGVDGEVHVELPDARTVEYDRFMLLRAWHQHCCRPVSRSEPMELASAVH